MAKQGAMKSMRELDAKSFCPCAGGQVRARGKYEHAGEEEWKDGRKICPYHFKMADTRNYVLLHKWVDLSWFMVLLLKILIANGYTVQAEYKLNKSIASRTMVFVLVSLNSVVFNPKWPRQSPMACAINPIKIRNLTAFIPCFLSLHFMPT